MTSGYCFLTFRGCPLTSSGRGGRPASAHAAVINDATSAIESEIRFSRIGLTFPKNAAKYASS